MARAIGTALLVTGASLILRTFFRCTAVFASIPTVLRMLPMCSSMCREQAARDQLLGRHRWRIAEHRAALRQLIVLRAEHRGRRRRTLLEQRDGLGLRAVGVLLRMLRVHLVQDGHREPAAWRRPGHEAGHDPRTPPPARPPDGARSRRPSISPPPSPSPGPPSPPALPASPRRREPCLRAGRASAPVLAPMALILPVRRAAGHHPGLYLPLYVERGSLNRHSPADNLPTNELQGHDLRQDDGLARRLHVEELVGFLRLLEPPAVREELLHVDLPVERRTRRTRPGLAWRRYRSRPR